MSLVIDKPTILETIQKVKQFSFEEKKESQIDESKINQLLDRILWFKKMLSDKTDKIYAIVEKAEEITWYNELDNESLLLINDLISSMRDLHSSLIRQYVSFNYIRSKGVAKEEIKRFKASLDELKDISNDFESIYFFLPRIPEFQETTKLLSLL